MTQREQFQAFRAKQEAGNLILLDAVTREQFESVHGPGSSARLRKSQLISMGSGRRYVRRAAIEVGPLKHS